MISKESICLLGMFLSNFRDLKIRLNLEKVNFSSFGLNEQTLLDNFSNRCINISIAKILEDKGALAYTTIVAANASRFNI